MPHTLAPLLLSYFTFRIQWLLDLMCKYCILRNPRFWCFALGLIIPSLPPQDNPWLSLICSYPCSLPETLLCFDSFTSEQLKPCYQLGGRNPSKLGNTGASLHRCAIPSTQEERDGNVLRATGKHRPPVSEGSTKITLVELHYIWAILFPVSSSVNWDYQYHHLAGLGRKLDETAHVKYLK